MRKHLLFLILIATSLFRNECSSQVWQPLNNYPATGRDDGSVFVIGNYAYCGLGNAAGFGPSSDFYRFDIASQLWSNYTVTPLPAIGRQYCSSFSYSQYGYILGGADANWQASNLVWRYDTVSNSWSQKTSIPDSVQGSVCFFINNKAFLCGGRDRNNACTGKVWQYDPVTDTWLQKNYMPKGGRWRASGTALNNKGYLLFGADSSGHFSNKLFEYDPIPDTWTMIDSFPGIGRTYASAFNANNQLTFAFGIDSANVVYNDCHFYNPSLHQWQTGAPLPSFGRKGCMPFSSGISIFITAGIDGSSNRLVQTWMAGLNNSVKNYENSNAYLQVFPIPASNKLNIYCSDLKVSDVIEIFDATGKTLRKFLNPVPARTELDISDLPAGMYFVKVRDHVSKIVKE